MQGKVPARCVGKETAYRLVEEGLETIWTATATATRSRAERPRLAEILHSVDDIRDLRSLASIRGHQIRMPSLRFCETEHWQEEEPKGSLEVGSWKTHHGGWIHSSHPFLIRNRLIRPARGTETGGVVLQRRCQAAECGRTK